MSTGYASIQIPKLFNAAYETVGKPSYLPNTVATANTMNAELDKLKKSISDPNADRNVRAIQAANYMALYNLVQNIDAIDLEDGKVDHRITFDNVQKFQIANPGTLEKVDDQVIQFAGQDALDFMPHLLRFDYST